MKNWNI